MGPPCAVLSASPARRADYFAIELPHLSELDPKTAERFGEYTQRIYHLRGME